LYAYIISSIRPAFSGHLILLEYPLEYWCKWFTKTKMHQRCGHNRYEYVVMYIAVQKIISSNNKSSVKSLSFLFKTKQNLCSRSTAPNDSIYWLCTSEGSY
jgi:hypothetical protein